ncbi:MAG: RNA polymerase-associated protein rapA [Magnetococcales bacterium]|nr:RNA polymerase-associated protein rapA [Magnetococcales bacterium]
MVTLFAANPLWAEEGGSLGDWEVSGVLKNETAIFASDGPVIGEVKSTTASTSQEAADLLKFENSLNLFINGEFTEDTNMHIQLNLVVDTEAEDGYKYHENDTQNDALRELYVDTKAGSLDLRIGKQQVVWGTADGIKLLDIVNPTDWREFVQNTMEDARIPVWMIKAEHDIGENGNVQFIVAQNKENAIPGMTADGDVGQPFKMLGVDSITGPVNGFLNIVPEMGSVATAFVNAAAAGAFSGFGNADLVNFTSGLTVGGFAQTADINATYAVVDPTNSNAAINMNGAAFLNVIATTGHATFSTNGVTNMIDATSNTNWNSTNATSAFEYMPNATFATFDTFAGASSKYVQDYPDDLDPNIGFRYKNSIGNNFNFSLNYLWHYDANPYVDIGWESSTGEDLTVSTGVVSLGGVDYTTVYLRDSSGNAYGGQAATDPLGTLGGANSARTATLVFTEKLNRINSYGTAFDYALDSATVGPVVLRGEFLYQQDTKVPVIDRTKLGYGDLVGGMKMEDASMFKYVLGADFTFFTNLMVSGQFIQFVNMDYVDGNEITGRYTADPTTMHLSNGLMKAEEYKEFYSIFFSKPFGEEQEGRWNNILMLEEGGGYWNRFDVEYSFSDELVLTTEYNAYFGDEDTMFGQFKNSSNLQVGAKYLF